MVTHPPVEIWLRHCINVGLYQSSKPDFNTGKVSEFKPQTKSFEISYQQPEFEHLEDC